MSLAETGAVLWDGWRAQRSGPAAIARRQAARLAALVRFARERSPLYRELYRDLPADEIRLDRLPPVTKPRPARKGVLLDAGDQYMIVPPGSAIVVGSVLIVTARARA